MSKNKNKQNESPALSSTLLASWEDGMLAALLRIFQSKRREDGGETDLAKAAAKAPSILARVGSLTTKTKSGIGATLADGKVAEKFEIIPRAMREIKATDDGSDDTTYVTLNWRVGPVDMPLAYLAALVTSLAYDITRATCKTAEELKKAKRYGTQVHNAFLESIDLKREPIKDGKKTTGHTWTAGAIAQDIMAAALAEVGPFPAEALAFFKAKETENRGLFLSFDFDGNVVKVVFNGGTEDGIAAVQRFINAGVKVTRIEYRTEKRAAAAALAFPGLVYLGSSQEPFGSPADVEQAENEDIAVGQ